MIRVYLRMVACAAIFSLNLSGRMNETYYVDETQHRRLDQESSLFSIDRLPLAVAQTWIMYNRLPKAGSSTAMYYLMKCDRHTTDTTVWPIINPHYVEQSRHGLMGSTRGYGEKLRKRLKEYPYVLTIQHSYYTNFSKIDEYNGISQPQYINIYRDPISQSASHTDYLISETRGETLAHLVKKEKQLRGKKGICGCADLTHKECVLTAEERGCERINWYLRDETIRYLCGWQDDMDVCYQVTHSKRAYELARDHLYNYVFVGLTEHYDLSIQVFRSMFPKFFCLEKKVKKEYATKRDRSENTDMEYRRLLASFEGNQWDFKLHLHIVCLFWSRVLRDGYDLSSEPLNSVDKLVITELNKIQRLSCDWIESFPHPKDYSPDQQKYLWPYIP